MDAQNNHRETIGHSASPLLTAALLLVAASWLSGCGSPPAVTPLLRVAQQAVQREIELVEADRALATRQWQATLDALADAYDADVREAQALTPAWVMEATRAYAAARDALVRQQVEVDHARLVRVDNLRAAAEAQQRAIHLIEAQDDLLMRTVGLDLWRLDASLNQPDREDQR